jgi:hypothetical protein
VQPRYTYDLLDHVLNANVEVLFRLIFMIDGDVDDVSLPVAATTFTPPSMFVPFRLRF